MDTYGKIENLELFPPLILTLLFSNIRFIIFNCLNNITLDLYRTDISCLGGAPAKNTSLETKFPSPFGGVFAKNTSRETNNFPGRMAREI